MRSKGGQAAIHHDLRMLSEKVRVCFGDMEPGRTHVLRIPSPNSLCSSESLEVSETETYMDFVVDGLRCGFGLGICHPEGRAIPMLGHRLK